MSECVEQLKQRLLSRGTESEATLAYRLDWQSLSVPKNKAQAYATIVL